MRTFLVLLCAILAISCAEPDQGARDVPLGTVADGADTSGLDVPGGPESDSGGPGPSLDPGTGPKPGDDGDPVSDAAVKDTAGDPGAGRDPGEAGQDTPTPDPGGTDSGPAPDPGDCPGGGDPTCGQVTFRFDPPEGAVSVFVAGAFNDWKAEAGPGAVAMSDEDGDGTWEATTHLEPGAWEYKFVVWLGDGSQEWHLDPMASETVDDGMGGKNSIVRVPECEGSSAELLEFSVSQTGQVDARVRLPAGTGSGAALYVDFEPAPAGSLRVHCDEATIDLDGLDQGIHDVQIRVDPADPMSWVHLKAYVYTDPDWEGTLLYFAMTDRFRSGSAANDVDTPDAPPANDYRGGDFAGLTRSLQEGYFDDLGVGAIWISWPARGPDGSEPGGAFNGEGCNQSPKTAPSAPTHYTGYHGYWPVAFEEVDPRFGTLAELREMVREAHSRGIRILLDIPLNHVHTSSPYYAQHKDSGRFHQPPGICSDTDWQDPLHCWFTSFLADLDTDNPQVIKDLVDMAEWWVKQSGADGFRVDAVKHVHMEILEALRARMDAAFTATGVPFLMIGETFSGNPDDLLPFQGPTRLHGQFDFPFNYQVLEKLALGSGSLADMDAAVRGNQGRWGSAVMSTFAGNHDIARFITLAAGDTGCGVWDITSEKAVGWRSPPGRPSREEPYNRLRMALAYALTQPGVPLVYYGDEYGLPGAGDPDNRRMMRFGDELDDFEKRMLEWTRALGSARKTYPALKRGQRTEPLIAEGGLLVYARTFDGKAAIVALSRPPGERQVSINLSDAGMSAEPFTDVHSGESLTPQDGRLTFGSSPTGARILAQ